MNYQQDQVGPQLTYTIHPHDKYGLVQAFRDLFFAGSTSACSACLQAMPALHPFED